MSAPGTLTEAQLTRWEKFYGELAAEERALVLNPHGLLNSTDSQRRHVLRLYMDPIECPACQVLVPPRQALGRPIAWGTVEEEFNCPHCKRGLRYTVPYIGMCYWRLARPLLPATEEELARQ